MIPNLSTYLQNWNLMRILRLGMGVWLGYSAFAENQPLLGMLGAIFALQAILNIGCCGAGGCATPRQNNTTQLPEDISYEEIK